jgi:hypothetical protein
MMLCTHQRWKKYYNTRRTRKDWEGLKHSQFPLNILVFVWVNSGRSRENISDTNISEDTEVKVLQINEWARSITCST